MSAVRPAAIGFFCVLLLVVAAAALVPSWIDWTSHRAGLEAFVSGRLGVPVEIGGPVSLSLLPGPVLEAGRVKVGSEGKTIAVGSLRMQVALAPLLAGRIEARDLVLQGPSLVLPWPVPASVLPGAHGLWGEDFRARIEGGAITIGGLELTGIDAAVGADAGGTISATGTVAFHGQVWHAGVRLGRPGKDGTAPLDVALDGRDGLADAGLKLSGVLGETGDFAGAIMARGPDLSRLACGPAIPFRLAGHIGAEQGRIVADDLAFDLGGQSAHGTVVLDLRPAPRIEASLTARRFDLDVWGPALARPAAPDVPVRFAFSAETALWAGGLLRRVHLLADAASGAISVQDASAVLPGGADFRFAGGIAPAAGPGLPPSAEGRVVLTAPELRATLGWLEAFGWRLPWRGPEGALVTASLAARIAYRSGAAALEDIEGTIDATSIRGRLALRTSGRVPALAADLSFDRLDLTPYLPAGWPAPDSVFPALRTVDAEVAVTAAEVAAGRQAVRDAALRATLSEGRLDLASANGVWNGVRAEASGMLDAARQELALTLRARTADAAPAARALGMQNAPLWHGPSSLEVKASGGLRALGATAALELGDARLEAQPMIDLAAGTWHGAATLQHPSAWRLLEAAGVAGGPGLPTMEEWLGEGSLAFVGQLSGEPGGVSAESFGLTAGALRTTGALALGWANGRPRLEGRVAAETLPVPPLDPHSGEPLPWSGLLCCDVAVQVSAATLTTDDGIAARQAAATLRVDAGGLRLSDVRADIQGGALTAAIELDGTATPPALSGQATLSGLPLRPGSGVAMLEAGTAGVSAEVTATGYSPAVLWATLRGKMAAQVKDGVLEGFDLATVSALLAGPEGEVDPARLLEALSRGRTPFDSADLVADLTDGVLRLTGLQVVAPSGAVAGSGSIALYGGSTDLRLSLMPAIGGQPPIGLRVSGPVAALVMTPDIGPALTWMNDRAAENGPAPGPSLSGRGKGSE